MLDWDELVRREGPAVWRTIYRLVRNSADADECLQETFVSALRFSARQTVRDWPAVLKYLGTARAVDRLRRRMRRMRFENAIDLAHDLPAESVPTETAEMAAAIPWALAQIPAQQAEVISLHELEGWSYQKIAERYSMSTSAVGVLLHRTRKKLQKILSATRAGRV